MRLRLRSAFLFALLAALAWPLPAVAEVLIGAAGSLSGDYARLGAQIRAGTEQAVSDINAAGGLLGDTLRVEVGDDGCQAPLAETVANEFAGMGVALVVGHLCARVSIVASAIYAERGIIQISPATMAPAFTDNRAGPGVFRIIGREDRQGAILGAFLADQFADGTIAILHDGTAYGEALADATRQALNAAGKQEALYESFVAGERDYAGVVAQLETIAADVVFIGGYALDAGLIRRQMTAAGLSAVLVGGDALADQEYWSTAGGAAEGTLIAFLPDPARDPRNAELVGRFRANGTEPDGFTLYAYAAVEAWVAAARAAGSLDFAAVAAGLAGGSFETALGTVDFDEKGDVTLPSYDLYVWNTGRLVSAPAP